MPALTKATLVEAVAEFVEVPAQESLSIGEAILASWHPRQAHVPIIDPTIGAWPS